MWILTKETPFADFTNNANDILVENEQGFSRQITNLMAFTLQGNDKICLVQ